MQDDCSTAALGLPELMIVGQVELDDHFEFTIRYGRNKVGCPICSSTIARKHESTFQRKKDRKLRDKIVVLSLETRSFRCLCHGEVFSEPDHIFGPKRRWTKRLRKYLGERAGHQTVSRLAKEERVSGSLVRRSFTEETRCQWGIDEQRPKASRLVGLDEFSIKKRTFDTTTSDLDGRKVLGIVEGCGDPTYHNY